MLIIDHLPQDPYPAGQCEDSAHDEIGKTGLGTRYMKLPMSRRTFHSFTSSHIIVIHYVSITIIVLMAEKHQ